MKVPRFCMLAVLAAVVVSPATAEPSRILALGGSVTEIIFALGQQDRLIARDSTSTYPAEATALPDVGYLRALAPEGVLSVGPDLILAEPDAGPPEAVAALTAASVPFVILPRAQDPAGVLEKIRAVAVALDMAAEGEALATLTEAEMNAAVALGDAATPRKKVMFVLSAQGGRLMAAGSGTGADAMLRLAGADNAMAGFEGYKPVSDEAVIAAAPEVIVMMDRGGDHSGPDAASLFALPALAATPAATGQALVKMDGLLLLGFGPRTGKAIADLHRAIYPAVGG